MLVRPGAISHLLLSGESTLVTTYRLETTYGQQIRNIFTYNYLTGRFKPFFPSYSGSFAWIQWIVICIHLLPSSFPWEVLNFKHCAAGKKPPQKGTSNPEGTIPRTFSCTQVYIQTQTFVFIYTSVFIYVCPNCSPVPLNARN